ncbi:MAG: SBBP repeat-containing protein [candidate division WOR-3 bacterium]|nr:SBBP repeat-containing protein [candidate division WOR-3 bacterium]MDW8150300.1 SBBP repeat-containing protein [candidate division WOR-3 bacterium]
MSVYILLNFIGPLFVDLGDSIISLYPYGFVFYKNKIYLNGVEISILNSRLNNVSMELYKGIFNLYSHDYIKNNLPVYSRIRFSNIYRNVDLYINALRGKKLEFYFHIKPHTDYKSIKISFSNHDSIKVSGNSIKLYKNGELALDVSDIRAFQGHKEIPVSVIDSQNVVSFHLKDYNPHLDLVIDPTAFISSSGSEGARAITISNDGSIFVVGQTYYPSDFSVNPKYNYGNATQNAAFIVKLDSNLNHISTALIRSSSIIEARGVAVDNSGNVFITGYVTGDTTPFPPPRYKYGSNITFRMAFVSKFNNNLSTSLGTAFILSSSNSSTYGQSLHIDNSNNVYLVGTIDWSSNASLSEFASNPIYSYGNLYSTDAFVLKFNNNLGYSAGAVIGSNYGDEGWTVFVDNSGNVYVGGYTINSSNFGTNRIVFGTNGANDGFVVKLSNNLSNLIRTVILTSSSGDYVHSISVDNSGNVFVAGQTFNPSNFVLNDGSPHKYYYGLGCSDASYVAKIDNSMNSILSVAIMGQGMFQYNEYGGGKSIFFRNDTVFGAVYSNSPSCFGTVCPSSCHLGSGGGGSDVFTFSLSSSLNICYGFSRVSGNGREVNNGSGILGRSVFVAGWIHGTAYNPATYPTPTFSYGSSNSNQASYDVYVIKGTPPCVTPISSNEVRTDISRFEIQDYKIFFEIFRPSYLGFSVYSLDGKLIKSKSLGYYPPGAYSFGLELKKKGIYLLKVRIGDNTYAQRIITKG